MWYLLSVFCNRCVESLSSPLTESPLCISSDHPNGGELPFSVFPMLVLQCPASPTFCVWCRDGNMTQTTPFPELEERSHFFFGDKTVHHTEKQNPLRAYVANRRNKRLQGEPYLYSRSWSQPFLFCSPVRALPVCLLPIFQVCNIHYLH